MAKTPSPKVIAAYWLLEQLTPPQDAPGVVHSLSPQSLSNLAGSRVNDAKAGKVREQVEKISLKLRERMQAVVDKFTGAAKPSPKAGGPATAKKKKTA